MSRTSEQVLQQLRSARERLIETRLSDRALTYCIAGLQRMEEVLDRPLRVTIVGEYNSGKTSVADLLIGDRLLPTSVVSNTHVPVLVTYADQPAIYGVTDTDTRVRVDGGDDDTPTDLSFRALQIALPIERLKTYQILDTPPTAIPAAFVAEADIVIWCTVATRAWTESERAAWAALPQRSWRNALLVATHKDGLQSEEEILSVTERLRSLTAGMFRNVLLVSAEPAPEGMPSLHEDTARSGAAALRDAIASIVTEITDRRAQKATKIVRRLARLTFHHLASNQLPQDIANLLADWERRSSMLLDDLARGTKSVPSVIEDLLHCYAEYAERLRPGGIMGAAIEGESSRALTSPIKWPAQTPAARRLIKMLIADLTALLRMQSGASTFTDPGLIADYHRARSIVVSLADLDGAFDALGRMLAATKPAA
jgi:hypothetical protein